MNTKVISDHSYLFEVEKNLIYALYNALWLRVIFVEANLLPLVNGLLTGSSTSESLGLLPANLEDSGKSLIEAMESEHFLDRTGDAERLSQLQHQTHHLPVSLMYLIVTRNCNLLCDYCYLAKALCPKINADMTIETAKRGIDLLARLAKSQELDKPRIIFYGGEPMLNPEVLKFALAYATQEIPNIEFTMNSNATLATEEIAKMLAKYKVSVSVSIDGPKEIHDAHRVDRGGQGTFDKVIRGFKILKENGVDVGISCTITPENVDMLTGILKWLIFELGITSLGFNLMMGDGRSGLSIEEYEQKAAKALIDCFKITRDAGVYEDRMMRRVCSLSEGVACVNDCGGCGQQIVISPDGKVGVCQAFLETGENFVVLDDEFDPTNHPLWKHWAKRSPFNIPECTDCPALSMCGGGCAYNGLQTSGDIMGVDRVHCAHAKSALDFLVTDLWQKTKV